MEFIISNDTLYDIYLKRNTHRIIIM